MTDRKRLARAHIRSVLAERAPTADELEAWGRDGSELTPEEVAELVKESGKKPPRKKAAGSGGSDKE